MIWRDINGYEGLYKISSNGQVKSLRNQVILKQFPDKDGYYRVNLTNKYGLKKQYAVHRLLAMTFIENPENKTVINHIDGDKQNNQLDNLEWSSISENTQHGYDHGLNPKGEAHYACKLTDEQVMFIKKNYKPRDPYYGAKPLAEMFGVSLSLVSKVGIGLMRKG